MSALHFDYEIPPDEYVAAQLLYHKLLGSERRKASGAFWIILGTTFIVMAFNSRPPAWARFDASASLPLVLVASVGIWWMYAGVRILFPARYFRRAYRSIEVAGKSFSANVDEGGFQITGEFFEWRVKWPGVRLKGEDRRVFIFVAGDTIYIFGKKFLSGEQQEQLRNLSGLARGK